LNENQREIERERDIEERESKEREGEGGYIKSHVRTNEIERLRKTVR
jgi:hypothetical protein